MSRSAEALIDFAGERRLFRLSIGAIRRLQEACDAGPNTILNRLLDGSWRLDDLRETIMQGLIGGEMPQREAQTLVETWFDPEPKQQFIPVAQVALMAALVGAGDEDLGELQGEAEVTNPSPAASSGSPASTAPEPSSDTRPET